MPGMVLGHWHPDYPDIKLTDIYEKYLGLEKPPAYHAAVSVKHLQNALQSGYTGVVSAGCAHDIDASMRDGLSEVRVLGLSLELFGRLGRVFGIDITDGDNTPEF